jgi:hypothetical protein
VTDPLNLTSSKQHHFLEIPRIVIYSLANCCELISSGVSKVRAKRLRQTLLVIDTEVLLHICAYLVTSRSLGR